MGVQDAAALSGSEPAWASLPAQLPDPPVALISAAAAVSDGPGFSDAFTFPLHAAVASPSLWL